MFHPAHYVADNVSLGLRDNESLGQCVESVEEEIGGVVLWEADSIYAYHCLKVCRRKLSQCEVLLYQQREVRNFASVFLLYDIICQDLERNWHTFK